jgi:hypothetical protein
LTPDLPKAGSSDLCRTLDAPLGALLAWLLRGQRRVEGVLERLA